MKLLIIGAGPCGLGAAFHLLRLGHTDWSVYEQNGYVGGLSTSFCDEAGFTWDVGGHVLFSHYDYFDQAVESALGGAYFTHMRESWIRVLDSWIPYPFQNNIRHLPSFALQECLSGLKTNKPVRVRPRHFGEWMEAVFGPGIVKYFMAPYNKKVWAVPLESMSKDWIGERVSVVDTDRIEKNISESKDDISWGPNNRFKFPKRGGTGAIFKGIGHLFLDKIQLERRLEKVDLRKRELVFSDGNRASYEALITTIPIDKFIHTCIDIPDDIQDAAYNLVHNSGLIVGLGFSGKRIDPKCWMYFPEDNCPFYRVTNFHNYSPYNVPNGDSDKFFSFMCETSYSQHRHVDKRTIIDGTIAGLIASGLISEQESKSIVSRYLIDIPYSYPVPTLGRDAALAIIQPFLESYNVFSRGRFGAWKYEVGNMDHSFMQGVEVVDRILSGKPESTINGRV